MVREFVKRQKTYARVLSRAGYCAVPWGYRRGDKKASRRSAEQMSPFFGSTMVLRQRGLHSSHAREGGRARAGKDHPSVRARGSRSYAGNFQASGFPGKFMARSQLGSP